MPATDAPQRDETPKVLPDRINALMAETHDLRTLAALARRIDTDRASLSQKIHGHRRWYLDEVILVADALKTSVAYLIGETDSASAPGAVFTTQEDPDVFQLFVTLDGAELARRLRFLQETAIVTSAEPVPDTHPLHSEPHQLEALLQLTAPVRVSRKLLQELANFFHVPPDFLLELDRPDDAERVEAEIEFESVIRETGVQRVAARSLGSLSAAEIRAITAALRK
ncbi:helix-turn-helix domain-containing protein [Microbacterium amylolyticum]|uniref:Transcriptional regulator with XRE-family HTH domain n=1 Tax=Microbacterium amylolyticum TaxID=936337 RepID=A0ABS4ZN68_9MICO|nr:hypothetical protein [Microbacterium amylolyticum]MBP2437896.1 transcriptional regulator with XRE-family HTH domain [Microbacterium amylolyticum]